MINNKSIAFNTFEERMLTSFSIEEILLTININGSTNIRDFPLRMKMVSFCFNHVYSVLFAFT